MGQSGQQRWKGWVNLVNNEGRDGSIWSTTKEGMGQSGQQRGEGWVIWSTTFDCHRKSMESWLGTKYLVYYSCYSPPTVFRNL